MTEQAPNIDEFDVPEDVKQRIAEAQAQAEQTAANVAAQVGLDGMAVPNLRTMNRQERRREARRPGTNIPVNRQSMTPDGQIVTTTEAIFAKIGSLTVQNDELKKMVATYEEQSQAYREHIDRVMRHNTYVVSALKAELYEKGMDTADVEKVIEEALRRAAEQDAPRESPRMPSPDSTPPQ